MHGGRIIDYSYLGVYFMYMNQTCPTIPHKCTQIHVNENCKTNYKDIFLAIKMRKRKVHNYAFYIYTVVFKCAENRL